MRSFFTTTAIAALCAAPALAQNTPFALDEIIFSAGLTAQEAARTGVSVEVVTEEELEEAGNIQLSDYLATLPGVSVTQNGPPGTSTTLRIRGAGQGLIGVYIDGILVNDPTSTSGQFNGFGGLTTSSLRRVEILRGSQSAVYGNNAVAGVISISTVATGDELEGISQTASIEAGSFNTLSTDYTYTHRTGALTLSFGAAHTRSGGFSAAEENAGNTEDDPSQSTRTSLGVIYEVSPSLTIGANAFYQVSDSTFDEFVGGAPADGTTGDETAGANSTGLLIFAEYETLNWAHTMTATYLNTDRRLQSATAASPFSTPFNSIFNGERTALQYLATTDAIANTQLSFGFDWQEDTGTFTNLIGNSRSIQTRGVFAEANWAATPDFDIFTSIRYEESSAFGEVTTGRLAFSYRATAATTFRGAVATGYRAPVLSELYGTFPIGNAQFFFGNAALRPEESVSYELGVDHTFQNGGTVSATLYRLEVDNFIRYQDCIRGRITPTGPNVCTTSATNVNIAGVTTFQGVELSAAYPIGQNVTLTGAYTYTDAVEANGNRVARVPRHDLALALVAEFGGGWSANGTIRTVADVMDNSRGSVGDDYTVVGASIGYALTDTSEVYLRIDNLFDEEYQTTRGYGTSDRAFYLGLRARF